MRPFFETAPDRSLRSLLDTASRSTPIMIVDLARCRENGSDSHHGCNSSSMSISNHSPFRIPCVVFHNKRSHRLMRMRISLPFNFDFSSLLFSSSSLLLSSLLSSSLLVFLLHSLASAACYSRAARRNDAIYGLERKSNQ